MPIELHSRDTAEESSTTPDWTDDLPQTDYVCFFRSVDWAGTPLGPVQQWCPALRVYAHMAMSDSRAATLHWGPSQIAVYNASSIPLAARAHTHILESTSISSTRTATRPIELVGSIIAIFNADPRSRAITTEVVADPSIRELNIDYLVFDWSRVAQVCMNLLTTATKFMKTGSGKKIEVRCRATLSPPWSTNNYLEGIHWALYGKNAIDTMSCSGLDSGSFVYLMFIFSDTGIGMQPDEIDKIIEQFQKGNLTTHSTCRGSELGLLIPKELTDRVAGEIGVLLKPGMRSRFVLFIKTRRADEEQTSKTTAPPQSLSNGTRIASKRHKFRVLLIEDSIINQKLLRIYLTRSGHDVEVANHGVEALEILRTSETLFDVVVINIHMPVMDGLTCTREIRDLERMRPLAGRLPIIAITADARNAQVERAIAAGADRVMPTPVRPADLVALMYALIGGIAHGEREVDSLSTGTHTEPH